MSRRLNIAIVHLDLGIGGAERLIVDTALSFKSLGHNVEIITSHHDPSHCFEETVGEGLLANNISVAGDWLPRHIFGRFTVFCAVIRMVYIAIILILGWTGCNRSHPQSRKKAYTYPDIVFLDGVSAPLLLFHLFGLPTIFYCHFPDMLLCVNRGSYWKMLYRSLFDKIEEISTAHASLILVNSNFTQQKFAECFPSINMYCPATVLYPTLTIDTAAKSAIDGSVSNSSSEPRRQQDGEATKSGAVLRRRLRRVGESDTKSIAVNELAIDGRGHDEKDTAVLSTSNEPSPHQIDNFVHIATGGSDTDDSTNGGWVGSVYGDWAGPQHVPCKKGYQYVQHVPYIANSDFVFLSLNRYERKKNVSLALQALRQFKSKQAEILAWLQRSTTSMASASISKPATVDDLSQLQIVYVRATSAQNRRQTSHTGSGSGSESDSDDEDSRLDANPEEDNGLNSREDFIPDSQRSRTMSATVLEGNISSAPSRRVSPLVVSKTDELGVNSPVRSAPPIVVVDTPKRNKIRSYSESSLGFSPLLRESDAIYTAAGNDKGTSEESKFFKLDAEAEKFLSTFHANVARAKITLVIAGGYDSVVKENVEYLEELKREATSLGLTFAGPDAQSIKTAAQGVDVVFRTSVSNMERKALLKVASGLLYTPDMEHFGIVPLEAMVEGTPVIAVNSGGPRETVLHTRTGFLCPQTSIAFADAMYKLLKPVIVHVVDNPSFRVLRSAQRFVHQQRIRAARDLQLPADVDAASSGGVLSESKLFATVMNNSRSGAIDEVRSKGGKVLLSVPTFSADNDYDELHTPLRRPSPSPEFRSQHSPTHPGQVNIGNIKLSRPTTSIVMTVSRRMCLQCKKHVVDNFSIETMKSGLHNAIFVALGASRAMSQLDLLDKQFDYASFKRSITGNMKRVDEYSSFIFLFLFVAGALFFGVSTIVILSYYAQQRFE